MIHHITVGIEAARSGTRIFAKFIDASQIGRTFGVLCTLRTAIGCTSNIVGQAGADARLTNDAALRVGTAGTGYTRVLIGFGCFRFLFPWCTTYKWIATISGRA